MPVAYACTEMWKQGGAISRLDKLEVNKENAPSPILSSKHRKEPPETQQKLTSTLMTRTNTQKTPLVDSRNPAQLSALSAPSTHESMLVVPAPIKVPGSSDTEEDSQAISHLSSPLATPLFKPPYPPTSATVVQRRSGGSSDTEEDSQMPSSPSLTPAPAHINSTPAWTASPRLDVVSSLPPQRTRRREELAPFSQFDDVTPRPTKIRRTFAHEDPSHVGIFSSLDTPETKNPAGVIDRSRKNILELLIGSGKGKEKAPLEANTPSPLSIKDRSKGIVFSAPPGVRVKDVKGPGSSKSTNLARSLFAINPERNGGLDFQFEDVIRSRDDRRRLDAGDCECCREYYDAIGPLPQGPSAPLWRSPPATPVKPCPRHGHGIDSRLAVKSVDRGSQRAGTQAHKQAISRHRHQWARAGTPPGYWDIGFPSTQEAIAINDQAEVMHRKKEETIEAEARRDNGRYIQRQRD
ncbi:hypothetical protein HGRIS_014352 [Hohenbuehelia grisea]|uniref:DNA endonuclease activator Ctp1 C-terminal domain-containing protein n=1 Tax=Hohenbuehelia grisea TaxID=104357 RepID=A0ABR3JUW9_9AGAR